MTDDRKRKIRQAGAAFAEAFFKTDPQKFIQNSNVNVDAIACFLDTRLGSICVALSAALPGEDWTRDDYGVFESIVVLRLRVLAARYIAK